MNLEPCFAGSDKTRPTSAAPDRCRSAHVHLRAIPPRRARGDRDTRESRRRSPLAGFGVFGRAAEQLSEEQRLLLLRPDQLLREHGPEEGILLDARVERIGQSPQRLAQHAVIETVVDLSNPAFKILMSKRTLAELDEDQQVPLATQQLLDSDQVARAHADTPVPRDPTPSHYEIRRALALRRSTPPSIDHRVKKLTPAERRNPRNSAAYAQKCQCDQPCHIA